MKCLKLASVCAVGHAQESQEEARGDAESVAAAEKGSTILDHSPIIVNTMNFSPELKLRMRSFADSEGGVAEVCVACSCSVDHTRRSRAG